MKEECGNCDKWMKKSSCPLEKVGIKPSVSYPGCKEFITTEDYYKNKKESNFPDYFTIDEEGLNSLCYFLKQEYVNKTVKIIVESEEKK